MIAIDAARTEILDAHVAIERWFGGAAQPAELDALLARFSEDFSMITTAGAVMDKAAVRALFARLYGTRPGFSIAIHDLRLCGQWEDVAVFTYREEQTDAAGNRTIRRSTALLETAEGPRVLWRHLHETWQPESRP